MKDYYQILEVTTDFTSEQIRRNYRRLAMQYHPDRNPGNRLAEEKFKEIAEAYGVLTDVDKRRQYDASRQAGWNGSQGSGGFHYSQEDILRDLFRNAEFQQVLRSLFQEFQRSGLRADPQFISRSFFGGKGGLLLGGLFLFTSLGGGRLLGPVGGAVLRAAPVVLLVGGAIKKLLGGKAKAQPRAEPSPARNATLDVIYHLPLTAAELRDGRTVTLQPDPQQPGSQLQVRIPPGSRAGQRLRLAGQGRREAGQQGDLYLLLQEK